MEPDRARELLAAERARLEEAIAALQRDERSGSDVGAEPGEMGSEELFEKELETGLAEDLAARLSAVGRAEERLAAGTYGRSIDSGEPIPDERLQALPSAERTVAEERALGGR